MLTRYLEVFYATLQPLARQIGRVSLEDFHTAGSQYLTLLPFLYGLSLAEGRKAERKFVKVMHHRQDEIVALIKGRSSRAEAEAQVLLQTLLQQWRTAGYHEVVEGWQAMLRQEGVLGTLLAEIPLAEDHALAELQKGLVSSATEVTLPKSWEQAHQSIRECLKRYAIHGQREAFSHAKLRYGIRLQSYQHFYEQLSRTHAAYAPFAAWCQTHRIALQKMTLSALGTTAPLPRSWDWQAGRCVATDAPMSAQEIQALSDHVLKQLLLPPLNEVEWLYMQSMHTPKKWRLHILIKEASQVDCTLRAYQELFQLYTALLPVQRIQEIEVTLTTPQTLAAQYCQADIEVEASYIPVLHQRHASGSHTLYVTFMKEILQHLTQVVGRTRSQEKECRTQYHARATQPLIPEGDPALNDPNAMLNLRAIGHEVIAQLWAALRTRYLPLIDHLAYVTAKHPHLIEACVQKERKKTSEVGEAKEAKAQHQHRSFYALLPRLWKLDYLQRLQKHSEKADLTALYAQMDATGWCAKQAEVQAAWQESFQTLLTQPSRVTEGSPASSTSSSTQTDYPPIYCSFVENKTIRRTQLPSGITMQLINKKGQWLPKEHKTGGRHHVLSVKVPATQAHSERIFWVKIEPEQPGTELFVGGRDIETQVAKLAEQMTLAIHQELLEGKRTPQRQQAYEKSGLIGFYERNMAWLGGQKKQNGQTGQH